MDLSKLKPPPNSQRFGIKRGHIHFAIKSGVERLPRTYFLKYLNDYEREDAACIAICGWRDYLREVCEKGTPLSEMKLAEEQIELWRKFWGKA